MVANECGWGLHAGLFRDVHELESEEVARGGGSAKRFAEFERIANA